MIKQIFIFYRFDIATSVYIMEVLIIYMNAALFKIVSKSCCLYFYGREKIKTETIIIYYLQINLFDYNSKTNTGLFSKIALLIFLW